MIKTGDWTTADLVKYLVDVQFTLSTTELDRLRMTSAFPKESGISQMPDKEKVTRCKASELYEPSDTLRELGLPVIAWGGRTKWRNSSEEGLYDCIYIDGHQLNFRLSQIPIQYWSPSLPSFRHHCKPCSQRR